MYTTLYARAMNGKIKVWHIDNKGGYIVVGYGYLGSKVHLTSIEVTMSSADAQILSTIKKKKKEGYKDINDIYAITNKPTPPVITPEYLDKVLPESNLDDNYNLKPMKCQKFKKGKMKYPAIAQPKYNGVRAVMRWEENIVGDGLFSKKQERAVIRSKSGLEYHFPHITNHLTKDDFIDIETGLQIAYDGELYLHNTLLNIINSACPLINDRGTIAKTKNEEIYKQIVFVVFDVAIEDIPQSERIEILGSKDFKGLTRVSPTLSEIVNSDDEVLEYTVKCIANGYEGCVIRDIDSEYKFGSRPMTMMKSKQSSDAEFEVVDIIPKPREPETGLFVLRNDISASLFECNPMGTYQQRKEYLHNKDKYIGKMATVKFYERSGISKVPFHANVVTIRDYE